MTPALPGVLSTAHLPWAELQAARLDGDVYPLADAFCLLGEVESPAHRARAALGTRSTRLIAELGTAAWVWGVGAAPGRPLRFAVEPGARTGVAADGAVVREVVYRPGDLVDLGGVRVTSPVRTVVDLARVPDAEYDEDAVRRLAAVAGLRVDDCLAVLAGRRALPGKLDAVERLRRMLRADGDGEAGDPAADQAVETR